MTTSSVPIERKRNYFIFYKNGTLYYHINRNIVKVVVVQ